MIKPLFTFIIIMLIFVVALLTNKTTTLNNISNYQSELALKSIEVDTLNFEFSQLDSILKRKKIVFVGEAQHGDGTTFKRKAKLIKYLHDKHNFQVLFYEAGVSNLYLLNEKNSKRNCNKTDFNKALWWFWSRTQENQETIDFILKKRIQVAGFDLQFSGSNVKDSIFKSFLSIDTGKTINLDNYLNQMFINSGINYSAYNDSIKSKIYNDLDLLKRKVKSKNNENIENRYKLLVLENIKNLLKFDSLKKYYPKTNLSNIFRDSIMANNIIELSSNIFKEKKIIIWAANSHLLYNSNKYKNQGGYTRMGDYLLDYFGEAQVFSLLFTSYKGQFTDVLNNKNIDIFPASNKSFEYLMHLNNEKESIVLTKELPFLDSLKLRVVGYHNYKGEWTKMMDAIYFIDEMKGINIIK